MFLRFSNVVVIIGSRTAHRANCRYFIYLEVGFAFSVLKLLVQHQEENWPVTNLVMGWWRGYLSATRCNWFACGLANAVATIISCFVRIQLGLTFLVLAYPGCPVKEAVKWGSVCYRSVFAPQ